jgi:hypothetical protein
MKLITLTCKDCDSDNPCILLLQISEDAILPMVTMCPVGSSATRANWKKED